jgi:ribosomal-protein-alanine N-acetyltransferase
MQETDCADLFAMMSDPEVVGQTIALEVHHEISETHDLLKAILNTYSEHPSIWSIFAITQKSDNKFIGYCGYYSYASACKRAEIGYALGKEFWGKGIVPEACKALVQYGFKDLDLERIEATVYPENIGSVRVLEKLGMQLEGVLRNHVIRDGVCRDRLMYSLLKDEWEVHSRIK